MAIHGVDQRVYDLVTADAEDRRTEDFLAAGVDEHLHEPLSFALLARPGHIDHGHLPDEDVVAIPPRLGLALAHTPERWVGEEGIDRYAVAHFAMRILQEIIGDDLVIVVSGMGEGPTPVTVTECINVLCGGLQRLIDLDVTTRIGLDAGLTQAQLFGVRHAADGEQHMRARHAGPARGTVHLDAYAL